mgnify:CR=1 FL=1
MAIFRSFKDFIADKFYNNMFTAIKRYVYSNREKLDLHSYSVSNIDTATLSDISVKSVGIDDREGMCIAFDVAVEAEIEICEYSNRKGNRSDFCTQWFLLCCEGNLSTGLPSFIIKNVEVYSQRQLQKNPLSDSLVPIIYADGLEAEAEKFLKRYYPEALATPMPVDPVKLSERLGLTIMSHGITDDFSVFGELFFADCEAEFFDLKTESYITIPVKKGTIVVDPQNFLLRNLGSVNNTITHECVHWALHSKAFELEHLYNQEAKRIQCQVVGGIKEGPTRSATEWMEWQANSLAPRIQMPLISFKIKANEVIRKYRTLLGTDELTDIIETVINEIATFFCVSRSAAKIRMVDAGYEEAMGAFTYIDGRYVPPHKFKKGAISRNQTYSIGIEDAAFIGFSDMSIRTQLEHGCYVYVDSHFCLNAPKYIKYDNNGNARMTEYGRLHIDECCIAFELKVVSDNKYGERYFTECALFRDVDSGLELSVKFAPKINDNVKLQADAILTRAADIRKAKSEMPNAFGEALKYLMEWCDISSADLADKALMDGKMLQRMRNNVDYPKTLESVIAVCIGMQLPPELSKCLIEKSGFGFRLADKESHVLYHFFIENMFTQPLSKCNEYLEARGLPLLGGDEWR